MEVDLLVLEGFEALLGLLQIVVGFDEDDGVVEVDDVVPEIVGNWSSCRAFSKARQAFSTSPSFARAIPKYMELLAYSALRLMEAWR